jgi:uncharacterized protein YkwD
MRIENFGHARVVAGAVFALILALGLPAEDRGPSFSLSDRAGWDLGALDTARAVPYLSDLEKDVVLELNMARTNPFAYRLIAESYAGLHHGGLLQIPGMTDIATNEGESAVRELIGFLASAAPVSPLVPSDGMSRAARDHQRDQARSGKTGHTGADGSTPFARLNRYGAWQKTAAENIDYGYDQARLIVLSLLTDDGVTGRGHRKNIMNGAFRFLGLASGPHAEYESMTVMDFAGGYVEKAAGAKP